MSAAPAWSYSSLTAYETCPKRYYLTRVSKEATEPQTEATIWGNAVHKALELRIKDKAPLPKGMEGYEPFCARIEKSKGQVFTETRFALTRNLTPTGWMAKDCWVRGIVDVGIDAGAKAAALDWKTGKPKEDSAQLMLFAAFLMHSRPYIESVSTGFIWLKEGKLTKNVYTREQLPEIWQEFMPRVQRLEYAYERSKWEAKPSGLCKSWCPVGKTLCDFCGK